MRKIIVAGCGTNVGKTITSAILATMLKADYWKPIQSGNPDTHTISGLLDSNQHTIYPATYTLKAPASPHHAAKLENLEIDPKRLVLPHTSKNLIIETAGGVLTPLSIHCTNLDIFASWKDCSWVIVSRHYLGSINHTLLTWKALKSRKIPLLGIVFNGDYQPDSEEPILHISKLPLIGRLYPEPLINLTTIQRYAIQWSPL